jgi:hypothetical protein
MRRGRQRWWRIIQTGQGVESPPAEGEAAKAPPQTTGPSMRQDDFGSSTTSRGAQPMSSTQEETTCVQL